MNKFFNKITIAFLTFFIGIGAVGIWHFSYLESKTRQQLPEVLSAIKPVKPRYENPCDCPRPKTVKFYGDRFSIVARAVTMDLYGGRMQVRHTDYSILYPLLKTRDET